MSNISQNRRQTGTLFTCLTIFLTVLSALASCTSVLAGSFTTTYSGGALQGYGPYADYGTPGAYGKGSSNEGPAASDTSIITANFTWVPNPAYPTNDPEPKVVLIQQYSSSYWVDSDGYTVLGTGSCDNGLGSGITSTDAGYPSGSGIAGQTSAGYAYTLDSGDTISCTPSAIYEGIFGGCGVDYSAVPIPITISLGGAVQDSSGNWDILVGQQCNASTNAPSAFPSGTTFKYQWSVSGTTFQSWSPTTTSPPAATPNPDAPYLLGGIYTVVPNAANWYWNDAQLTTETVSCTVTPTMPAGYPAVGPFTVTKQVKVYLPTITASGTPGTVQVLVPALYSYDFNNNLDYWLIAGGATPGMSITATSKSPVASLFGDGSVYMVQLREEEHYTTNSSGIYSAYNLPMGLDAAYPYAGQSASNPYVTEDSPGIDLMTPVLLYIAEDDDLFDDFFMYTPPSNRGAVTSVPVGQFAWTVSEKANATSLSGNWSLFGTQSAGNVTPSAVANFIPGNGWPTWSSIVPSTDAN